MHLLLPLTAVLLLHLTLSQVLMRPRVFTVKQAMVYIFVLKMKLYVLLTRNTIGCESFLSHL
jgi:hypothetical protein